MELAKFQHQSAIKLEPMAGLGASHHLFDKEQIAAITAAWYAKRPLLVRGEPGLGKSQLAHAIAQCLQWNLLVHVVNSRTEPDDLLYRVDHVARLAKAQLLNHLQDQKKQSEGINCLDEKRFVVPGPLWWAYASLQAKDFFTPEHSDFHTSMDVDCNKPSVLLIDEIDKADSELPNSLLEVLNNHSFHAYGHDQVIECDPQKRPFVVVTSNDERQLPAAFLRRCVCLRLQMKKQDEGVKQLINIAGAHQADIDNLSADIIKQAAKMVIDKRADCNVGDYNPGTSEFLDLLRVLNSELYQNDDQRHSALTDISQYILDK